MPLIVPIMRNRTLTLALALTALTLLATGCNGPRAIHEAPVLVTGDRVPNADSLIAVARADEAARANSARQQRDSIESAALSSCTPAICNALARGEVVIGMSTSQVLAATRTTPQAWSGRVSGATSFMTPINVDGTQRDAVGSIMSVQLANDRVTGVSFRERSGFRFMTTFADTGSVARQRSIAELLVREGDEFIAAGDRTNALERYDRALVMKGDDAMLNFKVAQLLDQQLRPVEAVMRYQRFLLSLDLQRIEAQGNQNAKLAEAIALAQQRIVVLERRQR